MLFSRNLVNSPRSPGTGSAFFSVVTVNGEHTKPRFKTKLTG